MNETATSARAARGDRPRETSEGPRGLLKRVWREFQDDDIPGQAAKLAYYAFVAMPPAVMALFGLAGLVGSEALAGWLEEQARLALPETVTESIIVPFIQQVVLESAPDAFSIGLILALWGASAVFAGLMTTLNAVYDLEEDRPFLKKRGIAVGVMLVGTILFILAAGALLAGPALADALGLGEAGQLAWNILQWPLAFALVVVAIWLAYYILPNRDQSPYKVTLLKAAAVAAILWLIATAAFRLYIANFGSYTETYGMLGAFIVLLLWLYVSGLVVLTGGELASEMERR